MPHTSLLHRDSRERKRFRWSVRVCCLLTGLLLGTATNSWSEGCTIDAVPTTPPPTVTPAGGCRARVTLSWDVSSIPGANRALWELKIGQDFTNKTGREPNRADKGSGGVRGSTTIDLRKYGPHLTGQAYYFRVVAKRGNRDVVERSESVIAPTPSPAQANVSLNSNGSGQVTLSWNLQGDQQACSDASFYEVYNQPFTSPGQQNGRLYQGKVSGTSGQQTFNLRQDHGPGTYYFRVVGKYRGNSPKHDIGVRAQPGKSISIANTGGNDDLDSYFEVDNAGSFSESETLVDVVDTPRPTVTPAGGCSARVNLAWDVSSVPGANRALWELKIGQDFTNPTGRESNRADKGSGGVRGSKTIDLRRYGPYLTGQMYYFRVVAKQGNRDAARRSQSVTYNSPQAETNVEVNLDGSGQALMSWALQGDQQACSDASFYEVHKQPFTSPGQQNGRLYQGKASGTSGQQTFNLQEHGPGDYYFRVVGKYRGNSPKHDIGIRARPGKKASGSFLVFP